jgi:hypothetical protein
LTKLFELQYFDLDDSNVDELYQFVNVDLADNAKINNVKDLALYLFPNVRTDTINNNKLKSFLFSLNLAIHDLKMMQGLIEIHGKYEAFNCYTRITVKFAIDIVTLANNSDYLTHELLGKTQSSIIVNDQKVVSKIIERLFAQLDAEDALYKKIFF